MRRVNAYRIALLALMLAAWFVLTSRTLLPLMVFDNVEKAPFFFGEPQRVAARLYAWFSNGFIVQHLWITLSATLLSFAIGTLSGLIVGMWLGLSRFLGTVLEPFVTAANAMPRVVLAPIFFIWFGLGIGSKVAIGTTMVFFVVFFNVYQGVRETSPVLIANARMLGASPRQLVRYVYLPSSMAWVFASLHSAVGHAFVGTVVGEYLGSARGVGYLIHQAEGVLDINTVFAGVALLTVLALTLDAAVVLLEERLMTWRPKNSSSDVR